MKRLKGSVKAIIISVVAIVCIASIVLGCIFGIKHPNDPNSPLLPNIHEGLSKDQINFGNSIQDIKSDDFLKEINYSHIVDDNGIVLNLENIISFHDLGFKVYLDDAQTKEMFYFYPKDGDETNYKTKSLNNILDMNFEYAKNILIHKNKVAFLAYKNDDVKVVYFSLNENCIAENIKEIQLTKQIGSENLYYTYNSQEYKFDFFELSQDTLYIVAYDYEKLDDIKLDIFANRLENNTVEIFHTDFSNFADMEHVIFNSNEEVFVFNNGNKLHIEDYSSGIRKVTDFVLKYDCTYKITLLKTGVFLEECESVSSKDDFNVIDEYDSYNKYSYSFYSFKSGDFNTIELEDGYYYATIAQDAFKLNNLCLVQKKIDNDHHLINKSIFVCYDVNLNKIVSFENDESNFQICGFYGNKFLTTSGIYEVNNSKQAKLKFSFINPEHAYTVNSKINNQSFIVNTFEKDEYFIMNLDGKLIFESFYDKISSYGNGRYIARKFDEFYILDVNNRTQTKIEGFVNDDTLQILAFDDLGMYLIQSNDSMLYSLYNNEGNLLEDNITNYSTESFNNYTYLILEKDSDDKLYFINKSIGIINVADFNGNQNYYNSQNFYNNTIADNYKYVDEGYTFGSKDSNWIDYTAPVGYYPKKGYVHMDGTNSPWESANIDFRWEINIVNNKLVMVTSGYWYGTAQHVGSRSYSLGGSDDNGFKIIINFSVGHKYDASDKVTELGISETRKIYSTIRIADPVETDYTREIHYQNSANYSDVICYYLDSIGNSELTFEDVFFDHISNAKLNFITGISTTFVDSKYQDLVSASVNITVQNIDDDENSDSAYGDITLRFSYDNFSSMYTRRSFFFGMTTTSSDFNTYHRLLRIYYIYPIYRPNVYSIKLNPDNGGLGTNGTASVNLTYNTGWSVNEITCPTRVGYTFSGYYTERDSGTKIINYNGKILTGYLTFTTKDTNLYAHWVPNDYSIEFVFAQKNDTSFYGYNVNDLNTNPTNNKGSASFYENKKKASFVIGNTSLALPDNVNKLSSSFSSCLTYSSNKFIDVLKNVDDNLLSNELPNLIFNDVVNLNYISDPTISVINSAHVFDGWCYVAYDNNTSGKLQKLQNDTTFQQVIEKSSIQYGDASNNDEKKILLYAMYRTKSYYIAGDNAPSGGSLNLNGDVDEINFEQITPSLNWNINLGTNSYNYADDINTNSSDFNSIFSYKEFVPMGGSTIRITLTIPKNNEFQMYRFDKIELQNFAYRQSSTSFLVTTVTIYYDGNVWKINGNQISDYVLGYNSDNANYNMINIENASSSSITLVVSNCMLGTNSSGQNPSQAGEYGFKCVPYVCSNFTSKDNVIINNNANVASTINVIDISALEGLWINNKYFNKNSILDGYSYNFSNGNLSNKQPISNFNANSICRIGNLVYYGSNLFMNFNMTQVIAISPSQEEVLGSTNTLNNSTSKYFALKQYLQQITISTTSLSNLFLEKTLSDVGGSYSYTNLSFENNEKNYDFKNSEIAYIDGTYKVKGAKLLTVNGRNFILYLTVNESNNKVMYFLFSDMNNSLQGKLDIRLEFSDFVKSINIDSSINEDLSNSKYSVEDKGIIVKQFENNSYKNLTSNEIKINPSNLTMLMFTPQDGYLINNILIKLKDDILYEFNLDTIDLQFNSGIYSVLGSKSGGPSEITNHINYKVNNFNPFVSDSVSLDIFNGIYCAGYRGATWRTKNAVLSSFESFYLMISDIYDDVTISVQAISYAEFDFNLPDGYKLDKNTDTNYFNILNSSGNNLGYLTFAYKNNNSEWVKLENNIAGFSLLTAANDNSVYRLVFLGNAGLLKNGVRFYASGNNFSYGFNNGRFADGNSSALELDNNQKLIFEVSINNENSIFDKFEPNKTYENYISSNLNIFGATLNDKKITINSASYLKNAGGVNDKIYADGIYQIDDKSKLNSWFNDTVLTNIDYNFFADQRGIMSKINWQSQIIGMSIDSDIVYVYDVDKLKPNNYNNVSSGAVGYGLTFDYYEIPGYYLQYISVNNNFIKLDQLSPNSDIFSISGITGETSYQITYDKAEAKFTLKLFIDGDSMENEIASIKSIENNLQIDFYSTPYRLNINYNSNNINSSTANDYIITENMQTNLYYDTLGQLEGNPTMRGYTFAGWGSQYILPNDSYNKLYRNYSSVSSWTEPSYLFNHNNRSELFDLKGSTSILGYDYYVPNGFFISDTGFVGTQNYNFFLANKNSFMSTVGEFGNTGSIYIDLYAVWKANSYRIEFNLNDSSINNGSTGAYLSKSSLAFTNNSIVNNGIITAGNLKDVKGTIYYAYVTFDSNDWFVTTHDYSFKQNYNDMVTDIGGSENLLDIIVDRYGYSWLGWTSEKLSNNFDEAVNNSKTVFASKYNPNKTIAPIFDKSLYEKLNSTGILTASDNKIKPEFYYLGQPMFDYSGNVIGYYGCTSLNQKDDLQGVVFYKYSKSGDTNAIDYLNSKNNSLNIANFDTSLNYDAYSYENGKIYYNNDKYNYRGLILYAYWQTNKYTFEINYRDVDETALANGLLTQFGSSKVTNKSIIADFYFDDANFADVINRFNPVRIGYDFVGWAYRFTSQNESAYGNMFTDTNYLNNLLITSYSNAGANIVNNVLSAGEYGVNEAFGDSEKEHKVYLFAIWKAQKFTVNFSLNISGSQLKNLYDKDSNFAVALYNSVAEGYDGTYRAINQNWFKNIDGTRQNTFSDIIANIVFTATFDDLIGNSYFEIGGKTYLLKDLYATSAGYYFIGWLYDSAKKDNLNNSTDIVHNNFKSSFDKDGLLNNKFEDGITDIDPARTVFNYSMFMNLFNSNYKQDYTKDFLEDNKFLLNTIDVSGKSTNYGYVTLEDGKNYYLVHEFVSAGVGLTSSKLYYLKDGKKFYVRVGIVNNGMFTEISFDDAFMYVTVNANKFILRFDNNGIYYINLAGERVAINLRCYKAESNEAITFTAITTRQFTLYANWEIKQDLNIKLENGNNGISEDLEKPTPSDNNGLAGHYHVSDTTAANGATTSNGIELEGTTAGFVEKNINMLFDYYNNLTYDIIPYFNGRYLSEMTLTYYAVEFNEQTSLYVNIPYTITFKFSWNNEKQIIDINSIIVKRQGSTISNALDITSKANKLNGSDNNIYDASGIARLTMIDRALLENLKFIIDAYATGYSNLVETYERRDVNKLNFALKSVGSDIDIICKFSVQTFEVDIYNLFDDSGNTLMKREGSETVYDTTYTDYASFQADVQASASGTGFEPLISKDPSNYEYVIENLGKVQLATISNDCAINDSSTGYNVPYGYFLYGMYYDSDTFRPVDEMQDDIRINVNQPFNGYEYIYANGIYNAGTTDVLLEGKGADSYYSQCSPIIGRPSAFPEQAYLHSTSTYQFFHWFEYTPDSSGNVVFTEYAKENGESKYVNRNITLYAYQYSENKPTSVQFYTWGTNSYTEINDGGKYTLNSNASDSPYKLENNLVKPNLDKIGYTDENGLVRINTFSEYGVNRTKFVSDAYSNTEIRGDLDSGLMPKLLQTYWYYQESYDVLYFYKDLSALENNIKTYLKFDGEDFYIEDSGGAKTIVVLRSNKFESFSIVVDGENITLRTERLYTYDFAGAKMYVKIKQNGENRYYELKEVTDEENARYYASAGAMPIILNSNPRYYVDIEGRRYYTLLRNRSANSISSSAPADTLYTEDAQEGLTDITTTIVNINDYYAVYDSVYYKINYRHIKDGGGSEFVNPYDQPYAKSNTVSLIIKGQERVFYLNINNETLYLDENFTQYPDLDPAVELYCAVNNSYAVSYGPGRLENYWEITGITINAVPDPNSGFWYPGTKSRVGFVTYIKFTTTDLEKLKQKETVDENQQRIYVVFNDYIDKNRNIDSRLAALSDNAIENLKVAVSTRVSEYSLRDFLSQLIGIEKFNYENGTLKDIIANIPVTLRNIRFDNDGEDATIDLSVTVKYQFDIIKSAQTRIDDNIYAIPIYSPFVMRFDNSVTTNSSTKKVSINTEKANVSHFERLGNNIHVYNDEEDPINFVLMTEEQYLKWSACELPVDELTKLIESNAFNSSDLKSNFGLQAGAKNVEFDFATRQGTYYIVMFYYKYYANVSIGNRTQVIRVSDDVIKVVSSSSDITTEIVERKQDLQFET